MGGYIVSNILLPPCTGSVSSCFLTTHSSPVAVCMYRTHLPIVDLYQPLPFLLPIGPYDVRRALRPRPNCRSCALWTFCCAHHLAYLDQGLYNKIHARTSTMCMPSGPPGLVGRINSAARGRLQLHRDWMHHQVRIKQVYMFVQHVCACLRQTRPIDVSLVMIAGHKTTTIGFFLKKYAIVKSVTCTRLFPAG